MTPMTLLLLTTVFYAGYNVFMKVAGDHVPETASTPIVANIVLQIAALATSLVFVAVLAGRGTSVLGLTAGTYGWAVLAGVCIGLAEITYLYVFSGLGGDGEPVRAGVAIPFVVGGTILIAVLASVLVFREGLGWSQLAGAALIVVGLVVLFRKTGA